VPDCRNCGAPLRIIRDKGLLVCDHCGSEHEAPPIPEGLEFLGETSQACPLCSTPLWKSRLHSQPLLCCPTCSGLLIGMNVFTTIIDAVRAYDVGTLRTTAPSRQKPGERTLNCPSCGQPFVSHHYGGPGNVVIDTCSRCLVNWLDQGELRRIALAPDRQRSSLDLDLDPEPDSDSDF
jgi:Zn-finger nucleic acid-binding protein